MNEYDDAVIGDVVWSPNVPASNGVNAGPHWVVVVGVFKNYLLAAGISTRTPAEDELTLYCVPLPWDRRRHPVTGLSARCHAFSNWTFKLIDGPPTCPVEGKFGSITGYLPNKELREVMLKVRAAWSSNAMKPYQPIDQV